MASTHIEIGSTERLGAQLRALADSLRSDVQVLARLKDIFDQLAYGGDYVSLGAALGLVGQSAAANAETIYNLLGSVKTDLDNDVFLAQFLSRLG